MFTEDEIRQGIREHTADRQRERGEYREQLAARLSEMRAALSGAFVSEDRVREIIREELTARADATPDLLRCSFCTKSRKQVRQLIAGPTVFICDECVDCCTAVLAEARARAPLTSGAA